MTDPLSSDQCAMQQAGSEPPKDQPNTTIGKGGEGGPYAVSQSSKVVHLADFRERTEENPQVWQCGCGSQEWFLSSAGEVVCVGCRCESTILEVRRREKASLSSNEIVDELRHTYPASGGPCLELTAADAIERLTQINSQICREKGVLLLQNSKYDDEIKRLQREARMDDESFQTLGWQCARAEELRDRYRAALERIAAVTSWNMSYPWRDIAREALGPAEGTESSNG